MLLGNPKHNTQSNMFCKSSTLGISIVKAKANRNILKGNTKYGVIPQATGELGPVLNHHPFQYPVFISNHNERQKHPNKNRHPNALMLSVIMYLKS